MTLRSEPCEVCGATKTVAHHDDYAKPLDVRWLCRSHHALLHFTLRQTGREIAATATQKRAAHTAVKKSFSGDKQLCCWLDDDVAQRVETLAAQDDRSVSSWLRRLILRELSSDDDSEPVGEREAA